MTTTTAARIALTLVQAAIASLCRVDKHNACRVSSRQCNACRHIADATEAEADLATTTETRTAVTQGKAATPAASRVNSIMVAESAANYAVNADATEVEA